ncbi:MAG: ribonuclease HII [Treponema sp.]|nr:ribonuclease HII [Treponema sp.]
MASAQAESLLCGLDEAGRGPLAGPVCAAAVILSKEFPLHLLNDSKKQSPAVREKAAAAIRASALAWGIGWVSETEIDEINILQASLLAMKRAFEEMLPMLATKALPPADLYAIADGLYAPELSVSCQAMVKADAKVPEVMAASILAKTERDTHMKKMALLYPQYGFEKHKGYPTLAHRQAIARFGPSPIQRRSFVVKVT